MYSSKILFYSFGGNNANISTRDTNTNLFRPSLALVSSIKISSGDGTATNPYKIAV